MKVMATLVVVLGLSLVALNGARRANASTAHKCTVTNVVWTSDPAITGRQMNVVCSDSFVSIIYASGGGAPTGCPTVDADTMKYWLSLTQAAKLSGRAVNLWTDVVSGCGSINALRSVELKF